MEFSDDYLLQCRKILLKYGGVVDNGLEATCVSWHYLVHKIKIK